MRAARHQLLSAVAAATLLLALGGAAPVGGLAVAAAQAKGLDSLADLAESVSPAVVNISAAQTPDATNKTADATPPRLAPGTPLDDLFEEFFRRRQQGGGNGGGGAAPSPGEGPGPRRGGNSLGSGFVIDPSGIVITNNHVIADANDITVIFADGQRLKAEVVGKDTKVDVAVLRVKPEKPLKAVPFGDSDKARVGDPVMAVGNPFGLGGTVTAGIVSARNRNIDNGPYDNYIQTDASINKGNSGGPLFNMAGEVIGINTAILSPSGGSIGIGFATPSATLTPVIDQLRQFGETRRGWLGVRIQNVDEAIAESLGLGGPHGALIAGIDDRGPAKPAGLKAGDVIVTFDGKSVKDSHDLPRLVAGAPVGKAVDVVIVRGGKEQTLAVTLGRLEDGEKQPVSLVTGKDTQPPATVVQKALGMEFSALNDDVRKKYSIKDGLKGVVVTSVDPSSNASQKRLQPGDVIVEVNQEPVTEPKDIAAKAQALKDAGKKSALMLVTSAQGEIRFVVLPIQ